MTSAKKKKKMKMKDKILNAAYGKVSVTPTCIDGDSDAIQAAITALHNEGLINILSSSSHCGKSSILNLRLRRKARSW